MVLGRATIPLTYQRPECVERNVHATERVSNVMSALIISETMLAYTCELVNVAKAKLVTAYTK